MRRSPLGDGPPSTPPPRRLLEGGGDPQLARVLAAAARPLQAPRALRERVLAGPLNARGGGAWRAAFAVVALGAGAAAALAVLTVRSRGGEDSGPPTLAEVVAVSGAGHLVRGDTALVPLTAGARIGDGGTVWSRDEPLSIALPSLKVKLAAGSGASFRGRAAGGLDIGLVRGEIALDVDPRAPDQPLVVTARGYQVRVVGTIFSVRAPAAGGPVEVSVTEGLVHVRGPATDRHLRPGDRWSSAPVAATETAAAARAGAGAAEATATPASAEAPARRSTARAPALRPAGSRHRGPGKPGGRGRVASARATSAPGELPAAIAGSADPSAATTGPADLSVPAPAPAGATGATAAPMASPSAPSPSAGTSSAAPSVLPSGASPSAAPIASSSAAIVPGTGPASGSSAAVAPAGVAPAPPSTPLLAPSPPSPPPPSEGEGEQARYQAAQALAAGGRYEEAAEALGRLAAGGGNRAELALFDRGKLLLRHLRAPEQAAEVFADHRRRFPRGSLRPDVDLSLVEALLAGGQLERAAQQIEHFLAAHPDSERRDEVRLMRAHLARERGDWRRARDDYDRLSTARGPTAEEALYFAAYCRRRLGDMAGARQTLERYLAGFPQGRYARAAREALGAAP